MRYFIWGMLALTLVVALPGVLPGIRNIGNASLLDVLLFVGLIAVVVFVGNFLGMAKRIDEMSKRK